MQPRVQPKRTIDNRQLHTKADELASPVGFNERLRMTMDSPPRTTDQKVVGSSPAGRARESPVQDGSPPLVVPLRNQISGFWSQKFDAEGEISLESVHITGK